MSEGGKTILLIIDPQRDFTDVNGNGQPAGSLAVDGAADDYIRIARLINEYASQIDEIHVSLDTHTVNHIGHYGYWKVQKKGSGEFTDAINIENNTEWPLLSIDEKSGIITNINTGDVYKPRKEDLIDYTKKYLLKHNEKKGVSVIWAKHCIENTEGHKIADTIVNALEKYKKINTTGIVKYHIKGQNELSEMYSIFGAVVPVEDIDNTKNDKSICYSGPNTDKYDKGKGCDSYEEVIKKINLETGLNTDLMENILNGGKNRVFVCGEARTHCVKSSMEHLIQYNNVKGYETKNIILLKDGSSPIPTFKDDLINEPDALGYVTANGGQEVNIMLNKNFSPALTQFFEDAKTGGKRRRRTRKNKRAKLGGSRRQKKQRRTRRQR